MAGVVDVGVAVVEVVSHVASVSNFCNSWLCKHLCCRESLIIVSKRNSTDVHLFMYLMRETES